MANKAASSRFVFPRWVNYLLPLAVLGAVGGGLYVPVLVGFGLSADTLSVGYAPQQPVPFSHAMHVGELGMDCRYCHTTVEQTDFAAIPSTQVCISCHAPGDAAGIKKDSAALRPVHESYETGQPIEWIKVHDSPDFVYFNHSAHVNRGVSCVDCHGRVDTMEVVYRAESLSMAWCLDCHREPEKALRPAEYVTQLDWDPREHLLAHVEEYEAHMDEAQRDRVDELSRDEAQLVIGTAVKQKYSIHDTMYMVSCSTCHR
ncbi:cytochrome c3 family protein [Phycisphaerales bacterium AB-hyl4]|uniref:Cytochrome c3 family protein n=1 Tax=Natronomicrosphaera hydrolytica TaxID=3242702 RepID=A0ABV4U1W0_9BACT